MKHILFMLMMLGTNIVHSQEYRNNHADVSIRFNYSMLENAIARLKNTKYSGKYVHGGVICSSPRASATIKRSNISMFGDILGANGDTKISAKGKVKVESKLSRCGSWRLGVGCSVIGEFTNLTKPSPIGAACKMRLGGFKFPFFLGSEIDPIIQNPPFFPIQLADTNSMALEFGGFVDGEWQPAADRHKKEVSYWADIGVKTSKSIPLNGSIKGEVLVFDASVGKQFYNTTTNKQNYREHYLSSDGFNVESDLFQLQIDQSLFLKEDDRGNPSGLLGEILPLRVIGKLGRKKVDVVLEGAGVKFGKLAKEDVIVVGAKVKSISSGAYIENAEGAITLSEPEMEGNELVTYIKRFDLSMETKCSFLSFCLSGSILENFKARRLVIAKLSGKIEFEVPNCIDMNDGKWEPDGSLSCPDGTVGRRGSSSSKKSTRIIPLFEKSRVRVNDYTINITVPARVETYNPTTLAVAAAITNDLLEIAEEVVIPESDYVQGVEGDLE